MWPLVLSSFSAPADDSRQVKNKPKTTSSIPTGMESDHMQIHQAVEKMEGERTT